MVLGVAWDLRKQQPYEIYDKLDFDIPVGKTGDCYERYLVRMEEMKQSNSLIQQCVTWLRANPGPVITDNHKVSSPARADMKSGYGKLDSPLLTEGFCVPEGSLCGGAEHPAASLAFIAGERWCE